MLGAIPHPQWWFDFLTTEPLVFGSLTSWGGNAEETFGTMFDRAVTFDDLAWTRDRWPGELVAKGVQRVDDARRLAGCGVDGITLSNHGGRQLDRARAPLHLLPEVVSAVGDRVEVHLDTGITNGADIVTAIALGEVHHDWPRVPLRTH